MSRKLIFDIETIGEDFDEMDKATQEALTYWIGRTAKDEKEREALFNDVKNRLGFSPLTGEIVAIGVLDYEKDRGRVYFQAPGADLEDVEEDNFIFRPMSEEEMLLNFWQGASEYDEFISFNGRRFDVPFLMVRSAIYGIKPTKNLMSNRYLNIQFVNAKHVDLYDQLNFYGASSWRGNGLHMWTRAFGIKSPKADGVTGDDVAGLFSEEKFLEIAKYNVGDLLATKGLYEYWNKYLKF